MGEVRGLRTAGGLMMMSMTLEKSQEINLMPKTKKIFLMKKKVRVFCQHYLQIQMENQLKVKKKRRRL